MEDLQGYAKQVEEFNGFGDLSELSTYLKKAQALNSKLETAMEKVRQWRKYKSFTDLLWGMNKSWQIILAVSLFLPIRVKLG